MLMFSCKANKINMMYETDKDQFNLLKSICNTTLNQQYDIRKFITLRKGIDKFLETKGRKMMIDELYEYAKTLFSDRKFIDQLVKFVAERNPDNAEPAESEVPPAEPKDEDQVKVEELEKPYKIYVAVEKLAFLHHIMANIP